MDCGASRRFFFIQEFERQEKFFNDIFQDINRQIALFSQTNATESDSYDMILINLCSLLNYTPDEVFKKDYNFLMKTLSSKAQSDANAYVDRMMKQKLNQQTK